MANFFAPVSDLATCGVPATHRCDRALHAGAPV